MTIYVSGVSTYQWLNLISVYITKTPINCLIYESEIQQNMTTIAMFMIIDNIINKIVGVPK